MDFQDQWDRHEKPPFTLGPWRLYREDGYFSVVKSPPRVEDGRVRGHFVADVCDPREEGEEAPDIEANALLLAAAPELFDALDAAPIIRLGETFEQFSDRYGRWYRESRVPALKRTYGG